MASQITSLTVVYSIVYAGADQIKHQSSASLAFVRRIHRDPRKWPVTQKMFLFHDVIMNYFVRVIAEYYSTIAAKYQFFFGADELYIRIIW